MGNITRNVLALVLAAGTLALPLLVIRASYEISLVGAAQEIEQLRFDMQSISGVNSEAVLGQAIAWNQRIRRMQAYNARWWGDPFIPDGWDRIPLLPISQQEESSPPRLAQQ